MIVLKKTYNELFKLFQKEKHSNLELYHQVEELRRKNQEVQRELYQLKNILDSIKDLL